MKSDVCKGDEIVELYFYDELPAGDRPQVEAHIAVCRACRESLADLRAIEAALRSRSTESPPAGDWSGFARRLESRLDREPSPRPAFDLGWIAIAAALMLAITGIFAGWALSRTDTPELRTVESAPARPNESDAIADASESGLARARVVLAGLAHKQEGATWSLERRMAATLLPDVRLIRQAAAERGTSELEDILMDVEMLLMQASYADGDDAETLERLRGMIDRRDVLMRLSLAAGESAAARAGKGI
jgi:anti-sigma factor RsiW